MLPPEKLSDASRKGGNASPPDKRSFNTNRKLAADAGHKGGQVTGNPTGRTGNKLPRKNKPPFPSIPLPFPPEPPELVDP